MRRLLTASALLALALLATTAAGQPPKPDVPKAMPPKVEKKADPTDAAIAAALANDPDVKMARAKIQLAEAELAKARLTIAQKVTLLKTTIDQNKAVVDIVSQQYAVVEQRAKAGIGSQAELLETRITLLKVQATLATAEAELRLLTGAPGAVGPVSDLTLLDTATDEVAVRLWHFRAVMEAARESHAVKGPIPERIRAALDKPVRLGAKGEKVTLAQAMEVFKKEAGLDVGVRPMHSALEIVSQGEELPVGAWFQMYEDTTQQLHRGLTFYVREYGLLVATKQTAPPDAPTLIEFWKQKPPVKDVKPDPKSEPKPK